MDCFAPKIVDAVRRARSATAPNPHPVQLSFTSGPAKHHDCGACNLLGDLLRQRLPHIQTAGSCCLSLRVDLAPPCTAYLTKIDTNGIPPEDSSEIPLLTISADQDGEFSKEIARRRVGLAGSSQTVDVIRSWLDECDHGHAEAECGPTASALWGLDAPKLPTRIIDVGLGHPARPYLLETKGLRGHYIALTHRWGGFNGVLTSKETLSEYEASLPVERIPQTFQDVIRLAQELGLRYIWIDILCIVQDDDDEWVREAAAFGVIFDSAYLTVAASSASDASSGMFLPRSPEKQFVPILAWPGHEDLYISEYSPFSFDLLDDLQIYKRAWVMQELLLSRRILHIGVDQVYWQCDHIFKAENGEVRSGSTLRNIISPFWKKREMDEPYHEGLCLAWSSLIKAYSKCFISFAEDKLPGVFKMAGKIIEVSGLEYDQGHWLQPWNYSACSLLWFAAAGPLKVPPHERRPARTILPTQKVVPSWSWASLDGPLDFLLHYYMDTEGWTHADFEPNASIVGLQEPYRIGKMLHTPLTLRGTVVLLSELIIHAPWSASDGPVQPFPTRGRALSQQGNNPAGWLCMDLDESPQKLSAIQMFTPKTGGRSLVLVVRPAGEGFPADWYRRSGVGLLEPAHFPSDEGLRQNLTLV